MGREIRRVPSNWQHPKDKNGYYIPLFEKFEDALKRWQEEYEKWDQGLIWSFDNESYTEKIGSEKNMSFECWAGEKPNTSDFMPTWSDSEKTHYQLYENTTEGTPKSPPMSSIEDLAQWLTDNKVSIFGSQEGYSSYEKWLNFCIGL